MASWQAVALLVLAACSKSPDGDAAAPAVVDESTACIPDDAAGTTWNDTDHSIGVEKLWAWTTGEYDGRSTVWYVPEHPTGVVMYFEGTSVDTPGEGVKEAGALELEFLFNELVQAGFAIIDTEANPDPGPDHNDWDTLNFDRETNDDLDAYLGFWQQMVDTTPLEQDTPALLVSFSGGGSFLDIFAKAAADEGFDVRGASLHSAGWLWEPDVNTFPTVWLTAENEWVNNDVVSEDGTGVAWDAYNSALDAGNESLYLELPEVPFTPQRMQINPDYDAVAAADAFDDLVNLGIVDEAGNRAFDDMLQFEEMEQFYIDEAWVEGPERVADELEVAWAVHHLNGLRAIDECKFLIPAFAQR